MQCDSLARELERGQNFGGGKLDHLDSGGDVMSKAGSSSSESDENSKESSSSDSSCSSSSSSGSSSSSSSNSGSSDSESSSQEAEFSIPPKKDTSSQGLKLFLARHRQGGDIFVPENEANLSTAHGTPMSQIRNVAVKEKSCSVARSSVSSSSSESEKKPSLLSSKLQSEMSRTVPAKVLDRPRSAPSQRSEDRVCDVQASSAGASATTCVPARTLSSAVVNLRGDLRDRATESDHRSTSISYSGSAQRTTTVTQTSCSGGVQRTVTPGPEKEGSVSAMRDVNVPVKRPERASASIVTSNTTGYTSTEEDSEDNRRHHKSLPQVPQTAAPCLVEHHDSLLRLDSMSMPNVSPDSGIQSIAGSPSGNDSPSSVTSVSTGEHGCEPQPQHHPHVLPSVHEARQSQEKLPSLPPPPVLQPSVHHDTDENVDRTRSCKTLTAEGTAKQRVGDESGAVTVNLGAEFSRVVLDADVVVTEIPNPFKGPPSGRKKRGRPPKSKKAQFLQHKKSTLYSGLYSSSDTSVQMSSVPEPTGDKSGHSESRTVAESIGCESQDKSSSSTTCVRTETQTDDGAVSTVSQDDAASVSEGTGASSNETAPPVRKRGPGRPKGTKRHKKNFFTYIKNRAQKLKSRSNGSSLESVVEQTADEHLPASSPEKVRTSPAAALNPSSDEPVVKRKRGRPRKNPLPGEAGPRPKPVTVSTKVPRGRPVHSLNRGKRTKEMLGNRSPTLGCAKRKRQSSLERITSNLEKRISGDSELASLIQSIQASIHTQFQGGDLDESSEFAMDTNNDISVIEPSLLPSSSTKEPTKPGLKSPKSSHRVISTKPKKTKVHVMMRQTKRRKRKFLHVKSDSSKPPSMSPSKSPSSQSTSSFKDLSQQQSSLFGTSPSRSLGFFRYRHSKILKQSSFSLHSSALGNALNRQRGDDSSGDEGDGSEGRRKKKKKKLLYFKSKHKNIIDPAFVAELNTLESSMEGLTISEKTYIRVKPGEVPLPSIFKLTIIDVKKKKKDRLILEPPVAVDKTKKAKVKKDSREREPVMPELVKEKPKAVRKKSQSDDIHPPSLEIQVARDQCLPPKKRHRMMFAVEATVAPSATPSEPHPPEKRKPGRPRKHPLPGTNSSDKGGASDPKEISRPVREASLTPVSSPTRATQKGLKQRHRSVESGDRSPGPRSMSSPVSQPKSPVLTCPRHASYKSLSELTACAECTLLAQSQPETWPRSQASARRDALDSSPTRPSKTRQQLLKKPPVKVSNKAPRKNVCSSSSDSTVDAGRGAISPKSRTKLAAASLPSAEVVINPLPKSLTAVIQSLSARKVLCNTSTSDFSDSGADDDSVIRNVCSESEPLPIEHCRKRKLPLSESDATGKSKRRSKEASHDNWGKESSGKSDGAFATSVGPSSSTNSSRRCSQDSQPPRKRYQRVGLFSDFYKDDEPKKRSENMLRNQGKTVFSREESATSLLPPPLHFGKHFRETLRDFQLPYDIWWLHSNDMLPKKEEPRPKFKRIRNNIYVDVKPNTRKFEPHPCNCKKSTDSHEKGCQEDCLNRVIFTECTPETCPCGEQCSNQRIQRQNFAPALEKFVTEDRGFGVCTLKPIPSGHFILEYLGEVVSETEFRRRMTEEYSQERHHYCLNMDGRTVIDGYRMGNLTRFVNHACQPNCEMQKWNVNGLYRMVLFALRDIQPYEEISYDYNFHAFNLETQQACRCGSSQCRGVIGGKWQRSGQVGTHSLRCTRASSYTIPLLPPPPLGNAHKHNNNSKPPSSTCGSVTRALEKKQQLADGGMNRLLSSSMKPMSQRERTYARKHAIFLVRNIDRARQGRQQTEEPGPEKGTEQGAQQPNTPFEKVQDVLSMKDVLSVDGMDRSVKTRLVALAEENPELQRLHHLAVIFNRMYRAVASFRDEDGNILSTPLQVLPSRKRHADYYRVVSDPIDLTAIRNNIKRGHYTDLQTIESDFMRLFRNVETYCGKKSEMGKLIARLRRVYQSARADAVPQLEELTGDTMNMSASSSEVDSTEAMETKDPEEEEEEEIIRCVCGVYRDEGLMIQCDKCFIWQHCDCVQVRGDVEHYLCEQCDPRPFDREVKLIPQPDDAEGDCEYYMTLLRDDLVVAIGDCVYLVRDFKHSKDGTPVRSSLRLVSSTSPEKMDIFRVEELYKNKKGEKFAMGTPYVRPQETFHEPTRKFFPNEVFRLPTYEIVPLELVAGKCVVMDLNTYCKGRPRGFRTQDLYICEYRVDKTAHLFYKIVKQRYPVNTKSYCFEKYETKLCPKRTFSPHEVPEEYKKRLPGDRHNSASSSHSTRKSSSSSSLASEQDSGKRVCKVEEGSRKPAAAKAAPVRNRTPEEKRQAKKDRLNKLVTKLMGAIPSKQRIDLSYLLEGALGKRPRKKPTPSFS